MGLCSCSTATTLSRAAPPSHAALALGSRSARHAPPAARPLARQSCQAQAQRPVLVPAVGRSARPSVATAPRRQLHLGAALSAAADSAMPPWPEVWRWRAAGPFASHDARTSVSKACCSVLDAVEADPHPKHQPLATAVDLSASLETKLVPPHQLVRCLLHRRSRPVCSGPGTCCAE